MEIKELIAEIGSREPDTDLLFDAVQYLIEHDMQGGRRDAGQVCLDHIKECERDPSEQNITGVETIALWMITNDNKKLRRQAIFALRWLASTHGSPSAYAQLAAERMRGRDCEKDQDDARRLIAKALKRAPRDSWSRGVALGLKAQQLAQGLCGRYDHRRAADYYLESAYLGGPRQAFEAGQFFQGEYTDEAGDKSPYIDHEIAAKLYEQAMEGGFAVAAVRLACIHLNPAMPNRNVAYGKQLLRRAQVESILGAGFELMHYRVLETLAMDELPKGAPHARQLRGHRSSEDLQFDADILTAAIYTDKPSVFNYMELLLEDPGSNAQWIFDEIVCRPHREKRLAKVCAARRQLMEEVLQLRDQGMPDDQFRDLLRQLRTTKGRRAYVRSRKTTGL